MQPVKIIFWGYDASAEMKLEALLECPDCSVEAVIVPANRDLGAVSGIRSIAERARIPIKAPRTLNGNRELEDFVGSLRPDMYVVDSYSLLIPPAFLSIPGVGAFNFHPGKLPQYRGQHVLNWALVNGEASIDVTCHYMNPEFDAGDVLFARTIPVEFLDTVTTVFKKTCLAGAEMVRELMKRVKLGNLRGHAQDESKAEHHRARTEADGRIDWTRDAVAIYNLVRALTPPWPCAFCLYNGKPNRISEAYPLQLESRERPGKVVSRTDQAFVVATGKACLLVRAADDMAVAVGDILE